MVSSSWITVLSVLALLASASGQIQIPVVTVPPQADSASNVVAMAVLEGSALTAGQPALLTVREVTNRYLASVMVNRSYSGPEQNLGSSMTGLVAVNASGSSIVSSNGSTVFFWTVNPQDLSISLAATRPTSPVPSNLYAFNTTVLADAPSQPISNAATCGYSDEDRALLQFLYVESGKVTAVYQKMLVFCPDALFYTESYTFDATSAVQSSGSFHGVAYFTDVIRGDNSPACYYSPPHNVDAISGVFPQVVVAGNGGILASGQNQTFVSIYYTTSFSQRLQFASGPVAGPASVCILENGMILVGTSSLLYVLGVDQYNFVVFEVLGLGGAVVCGQRAAGTSEGALLTIL